jgi:hypothetical protein
VAKSLPAPSTLPAKAKNNRLTGQKIAEFWLHQLEANRENQSMVKAGAPACAR